MTMIGGLLADGPSLEIAKGAHVYDRLIGDWDAVVIDHLDDGSLRRGSAEIHFAWVLEGRAIQDTWIAPARSERDASTPRAGNRYGTTIRVYDAKADVWRVTWFNPVTGVENRLVGRTVDDDIVQEGDGIRWSFREITADSFHWFGEASSDGGRTWRLATEFLARRAGARTSDVLWTALRDEGFEHLRLTRNAGETPAFLADGLIVRRENASSYRVRYRITCDAAWRVRSVSINDLESARSLELRSDGEGHWSEASLEGARDVDILASPFTNTLAINRLRLERDQSADIAVVFIDPKELSFTRVTQRYTRVGVARYRYESLDSGFTTELPVDEEGLLLEYPNYFRRAW